MGSILEFPSNAASRRPNSTLEGATRDGMATVVILPVVRIERDTGDTRGDGPEEGAAPRRRRRRRT